MKPRIILTTDEFINIARQIGKPVVETEKIMLMGHMYVTTGTDYVYYAYSPELLELPKNVDVINAVSVEF